TAGVAADVPKKPSGPKAHVDTPSGPAMSGFARPADVGPCDENGSASLVRYPSARTAPTANASGCDAGSVIEPAGSLAWNTTPPRPLTSTSSALATPRRRRISRRYHP